MYLILITILVVLTALHVIFNKELFSNNNKNNKKKAKKSLVTMNTITNDESEYVKFLIQNILESLNAKYAKKLSMGTLEEVQKSKKSNGVEYKVIMFIYNDIDFNTRKYKFNFVLTDKAVILVRDIERADSVNKVLEYVPISERNSTLYKPKSKAVPDSSNSMTNLEFKELSYCEKKAECKESRPVDPLERNKTILPTEAEYLKEINYRPFPARKIDVVWDKQSCSPIECENSDTKGEYHGRVQAKVFPNYNPTLFSGDSKDNHWLFDLGADSASRPIGVTGARGN